MRIDAHQHFWKIGRYDYPWMKGLDVLLHDFGPAQLLPLLDAHRIDRAVLVQTTSSVEETRWFQELARQHRFIGGVVGWVELTDPGVGATLHELAGEPGLVGIRHQVHDEPDDNWLSRPEVRRGLGEVAKRGLAYDLLIRPPQLPAAERLARAMPELRLVVDHVAKPAIAKRGWDDWAPGIRALGALANVTCKLSGMVTEADWSAWKPQDLRPYVQHVLDSFGPDRVMFGSDWPVCLLAGSYDRVVDALEQNLSGLSAAEREGVFGNNAARVYQIAPHA